MKHLKIILIVIIVAVSYIHSSDFIRSWLICGPFDNQELDKDLFDNESNIVPQKNMKTADKEWKVFASLDNKINFESDRAFGYNDNCMGYAYVKIESPKSQPALLLLGSDDGAKVYFNHEPVLYNDIPRGITIDEDKININLQKGTNHLLCKIKEIGGGWGMAVRITDKNGDDIPGLKYYPQSIEPLKIVAVEASSEQDDNGNILSADYAVDGDEGTRWSSEFTDDEWLKLSLDRFAEINKIIIKWENAYSKQYDILFSTDNENWTTVYEEKNGDGTEDIININPKKTKYIKFDFKKRATAWGNSIFEIKLVE